MHFARPSRQQEERQRDSMENNTVRRSVGMAIAIHPREKDDSMAKNEVADRLGVRYLLATLMAMVLVLGATAARAQAQATASTDPDLRFLDGMIVHHQAAIDEATAIEPKAHRPEVKQLAAEIIKAQEAEIRQMREWRRAWFPNAPQAAAPSGGMSMGGTPAGAVPADPDVAFIEMMIPHHQAAVAMSREILETTKRPELQQLARNIIRNQEREIAQMESWKRS